MIDKPLHLGKSPPASVTQQDHLERSLEWGRISVRDSKHLFTVKRRVMMNGYSFFFILLADNTLSFRNAANTRLYIVRKEERTVYCEEMSVALQRRYY